MIELSYPGLPPLDLGSAASVTLDGLSRGTATPLVDGTGCIRPHLAGSRTHAPCVVRPYARSVSSAAPPQRPRLSLTLAKHSSHAFTPACDASWTVRAAATVIAPFDVAPGHLVLIDVRPRNVTDRLAFASAPLGLATRTSRPAREAAP